MNKVTKVLFYTSVTVVGGQALRYFYGRFLASADLAVEQSCVRDRKAYRRAIERWENEGGAMLAGHTSGPPPSAGEGHLARLPKQSDQTSQYIEL
jgi:hypothetical protein